MKSTSILFTVSVIAALVTVSLAADTYDARCTAAKNETVTNGNQTTVMISSDTCDSSKFLTCRNERCGCANPTTQIYTFREYKAKDVPPALIRTKRSPTPGKGGKVKSKSKGVGTGTAVAGGVVAGVAGYQLGKAVGGSNNNNGGSSSFDRKVQVYSCYSRVLGECAIDPKRINSVTNTTSHKDETGNVTQTTSTYQVDYLKYPPCVQHAECQQKQVRAAGGDANIGECQCKGGYKRTTQDLCTKGASSTLTSSSFVISLSLLSYVFIQLISTNKS